jgi:hypothetical protein
MEADFYHFLPSEANALYDTFHDEDALNVYVVEDISSATPAFFTYFPSQWFVKI